MVSANVQGAKIKLFGSTTGQIVFQLWGGKETATLQHLKG